MHNDPEDIIASMHPAAPPRPVRVNMRGGCWITQNKFDGIPPRDAPKLGDYLALMHAIMREENNCR